MCRKVWGFESLRGHQIIIIAKSLVDIAYIKVHHTSGIALRLAPDFSRKNLQSSSSKSRLPSSPAFSVKIIFVIIENFIRQCGGHIINRLYVRICALHHMQAASFSCSKLRRQPPLSIEYKKQFTTFDFYADRALSSSEHSCQVRLKRRLACSNFRAALA
jgi:hypothetical protein